MKFQDGLLTHQDKEDLLAVLDNSRRGLRIASNLLLAAEGPHDAPFADVRQKIGELGASVDDLASAIDDSEPWAG